MRIRDATPYDVPKLIALERAAETAAHWGEGQYLALFDPASLRRIVLVADISDQDLVPTSACDRACGFIIALAIATEWEIENIVVEPTLRRCGMGSQLLTAMLERARVEGCHEMLLEVRASNTPARKLYEKHGFREAGLRRGYYGNPTEDAVLLKLEIPKAALENA